MDGVGGLLVPLGHGGVLADLLEGVVELLEGVAVSGARSGGDLDGLSERWPVLHTLVELLAGLFHLASSAVGPVLAAVETALSFRSRVVRRRVLG